MNKYKHSDTKYYLDKNKLFHLIANYLQYLLLIYVIKLVNFSLSEGLVPDGFKKAVVTPLIKKASLPVEDLKNYRPVSGLSFISKLVERIVAKQLVDHIHRHGLDNSYQSAYKSGHSTEMALLSIKNDIHLSLSQREATALVGVGHFVPGHFVPGQFVPGHFVPSLGHFVPKI